MITCGVSLRYRNHKISGRRGQALIELYHFTLLVVAIRHGGVRQGLVYASAMATARGTAPDASIAEGQFRKQLKIIHTGSGPLGARLNIYISVTTKAVATPTAFANYPQEIR
jgi:hypothetical protein